MPARPSQWQHNKTPRRRGRTQRGGRHGGGGGGLEASDSSEKVIKIAMKINKILITAQGRKKGKEGRGESVCLSVSSFSLSVCLSLITK